MFSCRDSPAAAWTAKSHSVFHRGFRLDSVENREAREKIDGSAAQQILRQSASRKRKGDVAQLVRALPCHGRGRGFEPRRPRHTSQITYGCLATIVTAHDCDSIDGVNFLNFTFKNRFLSQPRPRRRDFPRHVAGFPLIARVAVCLRPL